MSSDHLLDWLEAFNRKERYYLISQALGGFGLAPQFLSGLSEKAGIPIPANAQAWMDYHLDWVYAALQVWDQPMNFADKEFHRTSPDFSDPSKSEGPIYINHDQEDIDLLIAFTRDEINHLIFVEAKGETPWSNPQMNSKVLRLRKIFEGAPSHVRPLLVLASPKAPKFLKVPLGSPDWIAPAPTTWRHLPLAVPDGRRKIERPASGASTWRVAPTGTSDLES